MTGYKRCTSFQKANRDCPSFPTPVEKDCKQYAAQPESKRWWDGVNPRREQKDGD